MEKIFKIIYLLPFDSKNTESYSKGTTENEAKEKLILYLEQKYNVNFSDITFLSCEPIEVIE